MLWFVNVILSNVSKEKGLGVLDEFKNTNSVFRSADWAEIGIATTSPRRMGSKR
jgi:hypothetical protein